MIKITRFIFNNFSENTFLLVDSATNMGAVVDPGMLTDEEKSFFEEYVKEKGIHLSQIILTHAHLDHCFGVDFVKNKYGVPVKGHHNDSILADVLHLQGSRFGMTEAIKNPVTFDVPLSEGDEIELGESKLKVIHVPGHTPGGIILYDAADGVAFVGDTIFLGSIGRTDLEGGDFGTLINSIKRKILTLPDETVLLPGHGEATTVGEEKKNNPFLTNS